MRVIRVIETNELGGDFELIEGKWEIKFPAPEGTKAPLSTDSGNAIGMGNDVGLYVDATILYSYSLVQDDVNKKIHLYRHQAGTVFNVGTAILIASIDMIELNGQFDDIAITDAIVNFTDAQTATSLTLNTNVFQKVSDLLGSPTVAIENAVGGGTEKILKVILSAAQGNVIKQLPDGLMIDPADLPPGSPGIQQTLTINPEPDTNVLNPTLESYDHQINDSVINVSVVTLKNAKGVNLGIAVKPITGKLIDYSIV